MMPSVTCFIRLFFQLVLFSQNAQLLPVFISQPSNPSTVLEGQNLILRWSYNLDGQSNENTRISNVTAGSGKTVVRRSLSSDASVTAGYENQFIASISDTEANLTILAVPRSVNGEKYRLLILATDDTLTSVDVEISVLFEPENVELSTNATANKACLGSFLSFTCSVGSANPQVTSYQLIENDVVVDTNSSALFIRMLSSNGMYKCLATNSVGAANSTSVNITVGVASTIHSLQSKTITEGGNLNLSCNASGTRPLVVSWVRISTGQRFDVSVLQLTNINRTQAGNYRCEASNDCGNESKTATVDVKFKPTVTIQQCPTPVTEGENATFYCNATGYPEPNITWINASSGNIASPTKTLVITSITRSERGSYIHVCHASNEIGNDTQTCEIDVYYPPKIIIPSNDTSEVEYQSDVICQADGNPMPTYVWRNATGEVIAEKSSFKATEDGIYTCFATNSIKTVNRSISITVKYDDFFLAMTIEELEYIPDYGDPNSQAAQDLREKVVIEINKLYESVSYFNRTEVTGFSEGSVVVSFVVYFNTPVTTDGGLANLQNAVDSGNLGQFKVRRSLNILDRENRVTTTPIVSTTESTAVTSTISNKKGDLTDGPPWPIIGGAIGAVVVVIIIILIVACWVHKKRKCRKDTKIHNSESEVLQGQNDIEDGVHAQVNGGYGGRYADAGPPSANGTNRFVQPQPEQQQQQQAGVTPPDYAVVDKSKKKNKDSNNGNENIPDYAVVDKSKKKKKKKAEAEDPYAEVEDPKKDKDKKTADSSTYDYAVVNKSKKKKKEEDENAYAIVDKSKKSKKKPKAPGEVLYADLDDFKPVQAPSMPTVSTSPEPLAPLKRPTSYQATEYADITQFLKGNATLPEGQSTEMQPTYANAGGGQGAAANKENANTGGKGGGGGDAEPKETPM